MGVTWISYRKKLELETILLEFGLERGGTVEEMRSRLIAFVRQQDHSEAVQIRLEELERNFGNAPTGDAKLLSPMYLDSEANSPGAAAPTAPLTLLLPRSTSPAAGRRMPTKTEEPSRATSYHGDPGATLLDRMTKWGLSFDGTTDPLCFIEHIEERADTSRIDQRYLAPALIVLLTGRAESWYRTSGLRNATWTEVRREFLDFFLPPRYYQRLEDEIRTHFQRPNEPFKEYLVDLRLQMRRAGFTAERELERIYDNMSPEYQLFIRRQDFRTLAELTHLAVDHEETRRRSGRAQNYQEPNLRERKYEPGNNAGAGTSKRARSMQELRPARAFLNGMPEPRDTLLLGMRTTRRADVCMLPTTGFGKRERASSDRESPEEPAQPEQLEERTLQQRQGRIRATITMGGRRFVATLDTGATHSFISEELAKELDNKENTRDVRTQVKLADGTCRELTRALAANIHCGNRSAPTILLVMADALDDVLLGMDFMCGIGATIQCGGQTLDLMPDEHTKPPEALSTPPGTGLPGKLPAGHQEKTRRQSVGLTEETHQGFGTVTQEGPIAIQGPVPKPRTVQRQPPTPAPRAANRNSCTGTARDIEVPSTSRPNSWSHVLPVANATTAQRNPFRTSKKRVHFQDHAEETPEQNAPLCGTVDSVSHTPEEPDQPESGQRYPEPWVEEFLEQELGKFENLAGVSHIAEHRIVMRNDRPIKQRYFPRNPAMRAIIDKQIDELLRDGRIEPSKSPHSAPIVIAAKKNGDARMCIDYRQLNENSVPDAYPLPRIHQILERLRHAKFISTLDLKNGYWQIPVALESRECTAFTVPGRGLFHWRVMPFGLHSAPATFQRALDTVIGPDMEPHAFAYLDDIIVIGSTLEEHVENLREVFRRLRRANLRLNRDKCHFFQRHIAYLGHVISEEGIHTDPDKVAAIRELKPPTCLKELRRCLGIASWYRRFVPNFADIVEPMTSLLKKGKKWDWTPRQDQAFQELKTRLTEAPVLVCPDFEQKFVLQTDASEYGIGAVLTQTIDGQERVVAYASRRLNGAEGNYSVTEKECLAIVWAVRKMRCYIEGYRFDVITDHQALKWLNSIDNPTGRIARWALELQQYQYDVHYRRGAQNLVADALSRQPLPVAQQAQVEGSNCKWLAKMLWKVRTEPARFPDYREESGQLYRRIGLRPQEEEYTPWKLCVGADYRHRVLQENHDIPAAGHLGVRKTSNRVAQRYYWPGLFRDVARYVRNCLNCQRYKVSQEKPAGHMFTRQVEEPFHILCADFVGPLPRSKQGNTMLLVFLDSFSKWVELIPLRRATGTHLERAFRERILSRFGVPRVFVCDNGTQFTGRSFRNFCKSLGMELQHTAPYTPRQNPTERANRTIKTMIAQYLDGNDQNEWDKLLPEISLAINSSISDTTGFSPAFLVQGREPRLPHALYDEVTPGRGTPEVTPTERSRQLHRIFEVARNNADRASADQRRHYNLRRREWKPPVGSLVLVRRHALSNATEGFAAKLAAKYDGPFRVAKFPSPNIVQLRIPGSRRRRTASLGQLKPYHGEEAHTEEEENEDDNPIAENNSAFGGPR
ncbi:hypothetical protein KR032_000087 [Drosophila birchii]|nr:hypothetical protein KR032_000087 [Drosophila birchii]